MPDASTLRGDTAYETGPGRIVVPDLLFLENVGNLVWPTEFDVGAHHQRPGDVTVTRPRPVGPVVDVPRQTPR